MEIPREKIEWSQFYWFDTEVKDQPRILLIGDSIVVGYREYVRQNLEGKAVVSAFSTSKCVGDPDLLFEVEYACKYFKPTIIHFNNGLHGTDFRSEPEYGQCLDEFMTDLIKVADDTKLIWASSTPISAKDDVNSFDPTLNPRVIERNRLAAEIMAKNNILIDDLYSLVEGKGELRLNDQYHYNEDGRKVQGAQVARYIEEHCL